MVKWTKLLSALLFINYTRFSLLSFIAFLTPTTFISPRIENTIFGHDQIWCSWCLTEFYRQFLVLRRYLMHIVTILSKASSKNNLRNRSRQFLILRVQVVVDFIIHWDNKARLPLSNRQILTQSLLWAACQTRKMLMPDDTSMAFRGLYSLLPHFLDSFTSTTSVSKTGANGT